MCFHVYYIIYYMLICIRKILRILFIIYFIILLTYSAILNIFLKYIRNIFFLVCHLSFDTLYSSLYFIFWFIVCGVFLLLVLGSAIEIFLHVLLLYDHLYQVIKIECSNLICIISVHDFFRWLTCCPVVVNSPLLFTVIGNVTFITHCLENSCVP